MSTKHYYLLLAHLVLVAALYNVADDNPIAIGELYKLYEAPEQTPTEDGWLMSNLWELTADPARIKEEPNFKQKYPSIYAARDMGAL
ncbi:hypothetical protein [Clostridium sp. YIM B02555]|uniref:hypothetical protein n=1 Tax=Clostridium sp. YIM B02555 TaxID=2911968 RepID=UPI001EEF3447|nr:hypothetical protein [Clostridium sp. YIM B02555]